MPSTLEDVIRFCVAHQKRYHKDGKFIGRTFKEWACTIIPAAERDKLHLVESEQGKLIGICIATERPATKTIWVHDIVCTKGAFRAFIKEAFKRFPEYKITGNRFGTTKTYEKRNLWATMLHQ